MNSHLISPCPPDCTCHGDRQFFRELGISIEEEPEEKPIPIVATTFGCVVFSLCFYAAIWLICCL